MNNNKFMLELDMWDEIREVFSIKRENLELYVTMGTKDGREVYLLHDEERPIMTASSPEEIKAYLRSRYGNNIL